MIFMPGWTALHLDDDDLWWSNKMSTDDLLNVFEFDSMAYKKFLLKKKVIKSS